MGTFLRIKNDRILKDVLNMKLKMHKRKTEIKMGTTGQKR
jgi:hypothetical protein